MLLATITSSVLGAHCYVLAPGTGSSCVIVDPGVGVGDRVCAIVSDFSLRPRAVLASHGHLDHIYDVSRLCDEYSIPFLLGAADQYRLADPLAGLGPGFDASFVAWVGPAFAWRRPANVDAVTAQPPLPADAWVRPSVREVSLDVRAAPGHTEGSVIFRCRGELDPRSVLPLGAPTPSGSVELILTGDVLFAGSIGRCDLPGGDPSMMARTLTTVFADIAGDAIILPGHGPATHMAAERRNNPYL